MLISLSKCCKKERLDYYSLSPCGSKICGNCMINVKNGMIKTCPLCKKNLIKENCTRLCENTELIEPYNEFIEKLNGFYLNSI